MANEQSHCTEDKATRRTLVQLVRSPNAGDPAPAHSRARCTSAPSVRPGPTTSRAKPVAQSPLTVKGRSLQPPDGDGQCGRGATTQALSRQAPVGPRPKRRSDANGPPGVATGGHGPAIGPGLSERPLPRIRTSANPPPLSRQASDVRGDRRPPSALRDAGRQNAAHTAARPGSAAPPGIAAVDQTVAPIAAAAAGGSAARRFVQAPVPYHQRLRGLLEGMTRKVGQENVQPPPPPPVPTQAPPPAPQRGPLQRQTSQGQQPPRQRTPPQDAAANAAAAALQVPGVQGQAMELRRPASRQERPTSAQERGGIGGWGAGPGPSQQHQGDGGEHQEEYWEWLFKSPPTPESPYGSDMLHALIASISPKFAVKRPDGYVPVTPSSISSSRYVRSDVWGWSCPASPATALVPAAAAADAAARSSGSSGTSSHASSSFLPLHSPQVRRGTNSPEPLHRRLMRAAAAAAAGLISGRSPTRAGASSGGSREHHAAAAAATPDPSAASAGAVASKGVSRASSAGGWSEGAERVALPSASVIAAAAPQQPERECAEAIGVAQGHGHGELSDLNREIHHNHYRRHHDRCQHHEHLEQEYQQQPEHPHFQGPPGLQDAESPYQHNVSPMGDAAGAMHRGEAPAGEHPREPQCTPPQPLPHATPGKSRFFRQQQRQQQQQEHLHHQPHADGEVKHNQHLHHVSHQSGERASALPTLVFGGDEAHSVSPLPAFGVRLQRTSGSGVGDATTGRTPRYSGSGAADAPASARTPRWLSPGVGGGTSGGGGGTRPRARGHVTFASPGQEFCTSSHAPCVWRPGLGAGLRSSIMGISDTGCAGRPHPAQAPGAASPQPQPVLPPAPACASPPSTSRRTPPLKCPLTWEPPPLRLKPRTESRLRRRDARSRHRQPDFGSVTSSISDSVSGSGGGTSGGTTPRASSDVRISGPSPSRAAGSVPRTSSCGDGHGRSRAQPYAHVARATGGRAGLGLGGSAAVPDARQAHVSCQEALRSPPLTSPQQQHHHRAAGHVGAAASVGASASAAAGSAGPSQRSDSCSSAAKESITLRYRAYPPAAQAAHAMHRGHAPALLSVMLGPEPCEPAADGGTGRAGSSGGPTRRCSDSSYTHTGTGRTGTEQTSGSSVFSFHMCQAEEAAAGAGAAAGSGRRVTTPVLGRPPAGADVSVAAAMGSQAAAPAPAVAPAPPTSAAGERPQRRRWSLPAADMATSPPESPRLALFTVVEGANEGASSSGANSANSTAVASSGGRSGGHGRCGSSRPSSGRGSLGAASGSGHHCHPGRSLHVDVAVSTETSSAGVTPREAGHGSDCGAGAFSSSGGHRGGGSFGGLSSSGESWGSTAARERTLYRPRYRPAPDATEESYEWPTTGSRVCGTAGDGSGCGVSILVSGCSGTGGQDKHRQHGSSRPATSRGSAHAKPQQSVQRGEATQQHGRPAAGAAEAAPAGSEARGGRSLRSRDAVEQLAAGGPAPAAGAGPGAEGVRRNLMASFGHASGPSVFSAEGAIASSAPSPRPPSRCRTPAWPDAPPRPSGAPGPATGCGEGQPRRRQWGRPGSGVHAAHGRADVSPPQDQGRWAQDDAAGRVPQSPPASGEGAAPKRRTPSTALDGPSPSAAQRNQRPARGGASAGNTGPEPPGHNAAGGRTGRPSHDGCSPGQQQQHPEPHRKKPPRGILDSPDVGPSRCRPPAAAPAAAGIAASPYYLTGGGGGANSRPQSASSDRGRERDTSARRHWSYSRNRERALLISGLLAAAGSGAGGTGY